MSAPVVKDDRADGVCILDTGVLTVAVVPQLGGRIVSLRDNRTRREWLSQGAPDPRPYGSSYTDRLVYGWDEMVPTITPCAFAGQEIPDHGEVWSVPWDAMAASPDCIALEVACRRTPLRLRRTVSALSTGGLRLDYTMRNDGEAAHPLYWAAHPMFAVSRDAVIDIGKPPARVSVARAVGPDRQEPWGRFASYLRELGPGDYGKTWLHLAGDQPTDIAIVDGVARLTMRVFPPIRDVALFVDPGTFGPGPCLALEPATAAYDSLAEAAHDPSTPLLAPGETASWWLELVV